jgi:hypothetical protein
MNGLPVLPSVGGEPPLPALPPEPPVAPLPLEPPVLPPVAPVPCPPTPLPAEPPAPPDPPTSPPSVPKSGPSVPGGTRPPQFTSTNATAATPNPNTPCLDMTALASSARPEGDPLFSTLPFIPTSHLATTSHPDLVGSATSSDVRAPLPSRRALKTNRAITHELPRSPTNLPMWAAGTVLLSDASTQWARPPWLRRTLGQGAPWWTS